MKMPTIAGIFIFISRENFMLSWVEHEKKFYNLGARWMKMPSQDAKQFWQLSNAEIVSVGDKSFKVTYQLFCTILVLSAIKLPYLP